MTTTKPIPTEYLASPVAQLVQLHHACQQLRTAIPHTEGVEIQNTMRVRLWELEARARQIELTVEQQ
jgi:hypothetical protein